MGKVAAFWKCLLSGGVVVLLWSSAAMGAGVAIMEQSPRWLGSANAGGAAAAEDAATVWFNPAGLTRLSGKQATAGAHLILASSHFKNEGSRHLNRQLLTGGEGGNFPDNAVVPSLYYSQRLSERIALGLGVYSAFGLSNEYDPAWVGRYYAVKSKLVSLNINPVIAWRVTDKFSVGAGVSADYLKAELSNAIDFGTIFAALGVPGAAPQRNDGFVVFKGDDWSWGFNLGAMYQFSAATRVGVTYRSRIDHTLRGDADFSAVPTPNPTRRFTDSRVRADVTLPDSVSLSLWHNLSPTFAVMADVTWTNWSVIRELRIRFDNPAESDAVTTVEWRDAFRYSIGAAYMSGPWSFRVGSAYDESPVPDSSHRTPRVPDSDRVWVAGGVGYRFSTRVVLDAAYVHVFFKDSGIQKTATGENRLLGALSGSYSSSVDIFALGVTCDF